MLVRITCQFFFAGILFLNVILTAAVSSEPLSLGEGEIHIHVLFCLQIHTIVCKISSAFLK